MSVVNLAMLWALPLALLPIIIYYLLRFRSLKVAWGANYVLERALLRVRKKLFLDQIILLALRVLACVLLVLAFARPMSRQRSSGASASGVHHVLVVDGSYSMLAGPRDQTRWAQASAAMKSLVRTWGKGETWSLLWVAGTPKWIVDGATVESPEASEAIINSLAPAEQAASLAKGIELVAAKFADKAVEITLVADDQASSWEGMEKASLPPMAQGRVYWLRPPLQDRGNVAVTSVRPTVQRVLAGHPSRALVSVKNYGTAPVDATVELMLNGAHLARETVALLPAQERWVPFDMTIDRDGSHYLTARLGEDAMEFDNRMSAGLDVAPRLSVMVLKDASRSGKYDSVWGFLELAGRIQKLKRDDAPVFTMGPATFSLQESEVDDAALAGVDVVLLDGGRGMSPALARQLRAFVEQGGGLLLAPDQAVDATAWNEHLGAAGLLAANLSRLRVEQLGGERFAGFSRGQLGSGTLRAFESEDYGDLSHAKIYSWYELNEAAADAEVLARFADGEPYLLRRRVGLGSVVQMAAGLNGRDSNLIVREFLMPLLFRVLWEASSGPARTVATNEPIQLRLADANGVTAATLNIEGQPPIPLTVPSVAGPTALSVPEGASATGLCSVLVVRREGAARTWFGVQGPRMDSDLSPLPDTQQQAIVERMGIAVADDWAQLDAALREQRRGREWHALAIAAALALLLGEMLWQRRFMVHRK